MSQLLGEELRKRVTNASGCEKLFKEIVDRARQQADAGEESLQLSATVLEAIHGEKVSPGVRKSLIEKLTKSHILAQYICPDRPASECYLLVEWDEDAVEVAKCGGMG